MFNTVETINDLGRFVKFEWDKNVDEFSGLNLILGYNGSGKSTLSNILRLYAESSDNGGETLFKALSAGRQTSIVVVKIDGKKTPFRKDCTKLPIYVFNSDFTAEHVYQGQNFTFKPFDDDVVTKDQLTNPQIAEIQSALEVVQDELQLSQSEKSRIEEKFEESKKAMSKELNLRIKGTRMPQFALKLEEKFAICSNLRAEIDQAFSDYEKSQNQGRLKEDLERLRASRFTALTTEPSAVLRVLSKKVSSAARAKVEAKIASLSQFKLQHGTITDWLEDGYGLLASAKTIAPQLCPLCESNITNTSTALLADYDAFFSEEYQVLTSTLGKFIDAIQNDLASIQDNSGAFLNLLNTIARYADSKSTRSGMNNLDDIRAKEVLTNAREQIARKKLNVELVQLVLPEGAAASIATYNNEIIAAKDSVTSLTALIETLMVDPAEIQARIKVLIPQYCNAEANESFEGDQLARHAALTAKIAAAEERQGAILLKRSREYIAPRECRTTRKTDVKDCQWIADLLQHGLLKASFIPPLAIRQLRDLTRSRESLIQDRSSIVNRIQKVLEDANIKLSSVASDVMGKSGWDMIGANIDGEEDPNQLAELARGRLKARTGQLREALQGRLTDHHRFLLKQHRREIRFFDELIEELDRKIEEQMKPFLSTSRSSTGSLGSTRGLPRRSSPRSE